jgi:hypothetical protein
MNGDTLKKLKEEIFKLFIEMEMNNIEQILGRKPKKEFEEHQERLVNNFIDKAEELIIGNPITIVDMIKLNSEKDGFMIKITGKELKQGDKILISKVK